MTWARSLSVPLWRVLLTRGLMLAGLGLSLIFLYSGIDKWFNLGEFKRIVLAHGLLGTNVALPAAAALASIEIVIGVLGLTLILIRGFASLTFVFIGQAALFLVFTGYSAALVAWPPPEPTPCGCSFLASATADWPAILARSAAVAVWPWASHHYSCCGPYPDNLLSPTRTHQRTRMIDVLAAR